MFSLAIIINVALAGYCVYYSYKIGQIDMQYRILIIIGQLVYMFIVYHLTFVYHKRTWFKDLATGGIILELFVTTVITVNMHGVSNYETLYGGSEIYGEQRQVIEDLKEKDGSFYRIYNNKATRNYLNMPSALSYNGESTFNTIYNRYNVDFITRSTMLQSGTLNDGALSISYHEKRPYFDEFVGVKYYLVDKNHLNNDDSNNSHLFDGLNTDTLEKQEYAVNIPFGYKKVEDEYDNFVVYENTEAIELGFAYENYIDYYSAGTFESPTFYETMYSNMVIIDDVNKEIYGDDYQEVVGDNLLYFNKKDGWYFNPYKNVYASGLRKTIKIRKD